MEAEFNVFTDFNQFIVFDSTADFEDLHEKRTDETVASMFVQGDRYIAIGSMRNLYAPVLIRLGNDYPEPSGSVDITAHGVLDVPSGVLEVSGSTDNGLTGGTLHVTPGTYRVLVEYLNLGLIDDLGIEGDDRYVITLTSAD